MGSLGGGEIANSKKAVWVYPKVMDANPSERWGHSACYCNGLVYVFGPFGLRQVASRSYLTKANTALQPPDVSRLAETARISLTMAEVEEFALKIRQVIDWFGQLQAVDLQSIEPVIRADAEGDNLRDDFPEIFENREAMIAAVPSYEDPYIKVPKVLNKE